MSWVCLRGLLTERGVTPKSNNTEVRGTRSRIDSASTSALPLKRSRRRRDRVTGSRQLAMVNIQVWVRIELLRVFARRSYLLSADCE